MSVDDVRNGIHRRSKLKRSTRQEQESPVVVGVTFVLAIDPRSVEVIAGFEEVHGNIGSGEFAAPNPSIFLPPPHRNRDGQASWFDLPTMAINASILCANIVLPLSSV
jgi:hypothetical protein